MVPGSTLRYGSSFCMLTRRPRSFSRGPILEAVSPLPRLEATPPVTNRRLLAAGRDACAEIANEAAVVRFGGFPLAHGVSEYQTQDQGLERHGGSLCAKRRICAASGCSVAKAMCHGKSRPCPSRQPETAAGRQDGSRRQSRLTPPGG